MLDWVFGRKRKSGSAPDYEAAKEIAASGADDARQKLASHEDLQPEFLYYFATDKEPKVRRTVASNPGTPLQADVILSKDGDEDVRVALTRKIGVALPELSNTENDRVRELVHEILETLANDQLPRVRALLAEEVKSLPNIPPRIAKMLAEDIETQVAAPILQYSPLLTTADLLEIIAKGVNSERLVAVARRDNLNEQLSDALVKAEDIPAISTLLKNSGAEIGDRTMNKIVDIAGEEDALHESLVTRGGLSTDTIMRIAGFVGASLLDPLIKHNALIDDDLAVHLRKSVAARLGQTSDHVAEPDMPKQKGGIEYAEHPAYLKAKALFDDGRLTENFIRDIVTEESAKASIADMDIALLVFAISLYADFSPKTVEKIFNQKDTKSLMAIAWQYKIKAEVADSIQRHIWKLTDDRMLRPTDEHQYGLPEGDLQWAFDLIKS